MNTPSIFAKGTEAFYLDPVKDRELWLALRRQDVTASDIGALYGLDKHKTPLKIYAQKLGMIGEEDDNEAMKRGRWLEPAVVEAAQTEHPTWEFRRSKVYLRNAALRIGCTPDIVAIDPERAGFGIVQAKTVADPTFKTDWEEGALTPIAYDLQTLTEAKIAGASWALLSTLVIGGFGTVKYHEKPIDLNDAAWSRICRTVAQFWSDVDAGIEPGVTYADDGDLIKAMYPQGNDRLPPLDLTGNNHLAVLAAEYHEQGAIKKAASERQDEISTEIRAVMKDATVAKIAGGLLLKLSDVNVKEKTVSAYSYRKLTVGKPPKSKAA